MAASQHEKFVEKVFPLSNGLAASMRQHEVRRAIEDLKPTTISFSEEQLTNEKVQEWLRKCQPVLWDSVGLLNAMDAVAVFFAKGIADEELAFPSMGVAFCAMVESIYPLIPFVHKTNPRSYEAVISLYEIWKARIERRHLETQVDDIRDRLKTMKDSKITPIGTDS